MRSVWLMYHDVYRGDAPAEDIPRTASVYHLEANLFRRHLEAVRLSGLPVCTVREHLARHGSAGGDHIVLTFDDGWEGSFTEGLEALTNAGFSATFFVTRDYVGRPRYVSRSLLRQAIEMGTDVGTHGCTHRLLGASSEGEVRLELAESKAFLEDIAGRPVKSASVPGGDWSPLVARIAEECGYECLCTSRPGWNGSWGNPFRLRRMAVRATVGADRIARYCRFSVGREVVRHSVLQVPKRVLGLERYSRLRRRLLGTSGPTAS